MAGNKKPNLWIAGILAALNGGFGLVYIGRFKLAVLLTAALFMASLIMASTILSWRFGYLVVLSVQLLAWAGLIILTLFLARMPSAARPPAKILVFHAVIFLGLLFAAGYVMREASENYTAYRFFDIPGGAMKPTIMTGDIVVARRIDSEEAKKNIRPGSIIIFESTYGSQSGKPQTFVKRIVATGGQRVRFMNGLVLTNDKLTSGFSGELSSYAEDEQQETLGNGATYLVRFSPGGSEAMDNTGEFVVPEGHYFVVGDNRRNSMDSRMSAFGTIPAENIYGELMHVAVSFDDLSRIGLSLAPEQRGMDTAD